MDTIDPKTRKSDDLEYILVLINHLTRYVELFPIGGPSAQMVVIALSNVLEDLEGHILSKPTDGPNLSTMW